MENSLCHLKRCLFGNRGLRASDFRISSTNNEDVIFALVELERPNATISNDGLLASALPAFDTICINSTSAARSFTLTGAFLIIQMSLSVLSKDLSFLLLQTVHTMIH
jgi:hypothetical protein